LHKKRTVTEKSGEVSHLKLQGNILDDIDNHEILSAIGDGLTIQNREFRIIYQNRKMREIFGDYLGKFCHAAYQQNDSVCPDCPVKNCFADGEAHSAERTVSINGKKHVFSNTAAPIRDKSGEIIAAVEVVRDITERKDAEERHIRFKNLYAALSLTNKAIMFIDSPEKLFREICSIAVEHGKFSLAAIVTLDTETGLLVPVAHCGKAENYLDSLVVSADPNREEGQGPTGIAFRSGAPYICNDFLNDPMTIPWRATARKCGINSSAAFPLRHEEKITGVLKVYSDQAGFFDMEIIDLLKEMTENISFALNYFSREERRMQAEAALRESEERLKLVIAGSHDGYCDWDTTSGAVNISNHYIKMLGYEVEEIKPTVSTIRDLIHPEDLPRVYKIVNDDKNGFRQAFEIEARMLTKSNEWKWILYRGMVVERDPQGNALRVTGTCSNIDERKRFEENLRYLSTHDALTGLYNRAYFDAEMARIANSRKYPVSILVADIDGLKLVNDSFGHAEGDRLIKLAAQALRETCRGEDMVARIGGDEFAIILPRTDAVTAKELMKRLRQCQTAINEGGSNDFTLSISIGSAIAENSEQLGEAYKQADSRMYYYKLQRKLK
jgi:diguanylate cyclase (GGDEF)-like protein/PAS domain S-box-containing protein